MPANVETLFYVREKPWHGLGTEVDQALTSADALVAAGLDWTIQSKPVFDMHGKIIPGYCANTRSSDQKVLGIVTPRYQIVQNSEAFEFTDNLVAQGMTYETAGSLAGGKRIWLLGKLPDVVVAGDKVEPFVCFTNTHDGTGAVKVCMTPVRVVCQNTLNLALNSAKRAWTCVHRGNIQGKLEEARETLGLADIYLKELADQADKMATEKLSKDDAIKIIDKMIDLPTDASDRQKKIAESEKESIIMCMLSPDLVNFMNTKWGFINAVADHVDHGNPARLTKNYAENRWGKIINGHPTLDMAMALVNA